MDMYAAYCDTHTHTHTLTGVRTQIKGCLRATWCYAVDKRACVRLCACTPICLYVLGVPMCVLCVPCALPACVCV